VFSVLALAALLIADPRTRDPRPFTAGSYTIEQRVKTDANRYAGTTLDFHDGGYLVWNRDGQPFAMMRWSVTGDMLRIDDTDLCPVAPVGLYRVYWQDRGFVVDRVADDCHERAQSATTMMMVPADG
jgi:hypothetical protein